MRHTQRSGFAALQARGLIEAPANGYLAAGSARLRHADRSACVACSAIALRRTPRPGFGRIPSGWRRARSRLSDRVPQPSGHVFEIQTCRMTPHSASKQLIDRAQMRQSNLVSGRYSLPAAKIACQKTIPRKATTIIRRIRARVSRPRACLSWEVSRSGSLMRNYSVARQRANLTRH